MSPRNVKRAYRLVEYKNGGPYSLFHGMSIDNKRTRRFPVGQWIKAERKMVIDGSGQNPYLSGFNILMDLKLMAKYANRFKADRELRLIEVEVKGKICPKPHSNSGVWLAEWMRIDNDWLNGSRTLNDFKDHKKDMPSDYI